MSMVLSQREALRRLPAVHVLLNHPTLKAYVDRYTGALVTSMIQDTLSEIRIQYRQSKHPQPLDLEQIVQRVEQSLLNREALQLKPVINVTGVVLHTNLGRAVLSSKAVRSIQAVAANYSNLEYDLNRGERGSRHDYAEDLLCRLTGAEAAMVVNNNAAAVWLILREMAQNREVIVSRGQLVEIGGSFRVSEIMSQSGARLHEVGTTNKTHLHDYERAINDNTAMIMKVHTSNFAFIGFHQEVERADLANLAAKHDLPLYEDLGSGMIYDLKQHGIGNEPTVMESVKEGAELVSFSGDKLLGGPQAGLIVGKRKWIARLKKNQLARAIRIDKLSLAALTSTLEAYLQPVQATREIPVLRAILQDEQTVKERAHHLAADIEARFGDKFRVSVRATTAEVGGGSLPDVTLPSHSVRLEPINFAAHELEQALRRISKPIIGRCADNALWWDPRTLQPGESDQIPDLLAQAFELLGKA